MRLAFASFGILVVAAASYATPQESVKFNGVASNGLKGDPVNEVRVQLFNGGYTLGRIDFSGTLTSVHAKTWRSDSRILVTAPDGTLAIVQPFLQGGPYSQLQFTGSMYLPLGTPAAGQWGFRFYEAFDDGGTDRVDATWDITFTLTNEPAQAPGATDLGELTPPGLVVGPSNYGGGAWKWFRFTVAGAADKAEGTFLDIDTFGAKVPKHQDNQFLDDTLIGLYDDAGTLVASDDDSCAGFMSQLSFGAGVRAPKGDGVPFDGRDGNLSAGTYYLAVGPAGLVFSKTFWQVRSIGQQSGDIPLNFALGQMPPPDCYPDFTGDGTLDLFDFLGYVNAFNAGDGSADCDHNGEFELFDFLCFVNAFNAGC
jgi:hypothetical protein